MDTAVLDEHTDAVFADLGDPKTWVGRLEGRDSLALNVIDAIQATRSPYASVAKVLGRYRRFRADDGTDARTDGVADLLRSFDRIGGADAWADVIGNRKPVATTVGSVLKAAAIQQAARVVLDSDIEHAEDLRHAEPSVVETVRTAWLAVPGQRSGLTWSYLAMLSDVTAPGHDHLVQRYLARAHGVLTADVTVDDALRVLEVGAAALGVDPRDLEHAMWRKESGRPVGGDSAQVAQPSEPPSKSPSVSR